MKIETNNFTLKKIFDIPERELTEEMLNFSGLTHEQKLEKWRDNIEYSLSYRNEYISQVQVNNKKMRLKWGRLAKNDKELQTKIMDRCAKNPLEFFNLWLWTYNPRLDNSHLPFITYPFQDDFIKDIQYCIEHGIDAWIEKSRDMGFSRLMLGIGVRGFLFHGWTGLIGSYKENYVDEQGNMDSLFERIRYIFDRLPPRMKPKDAVPKFMSVSSKEGGEREIAGDCGPNFGTGGRRKWVFLDEFALWVRDATALRKTKDVTNCRIFGGTPEGTNNVYGKVMTNHRDYKHLLSKKIRLLWKQHPLKTLARYKYQQETRTTLDLAKEVDISYETSVTGAVYPLFKRMAYKGTFVYDIKRKTYGSWDFGRDSNSFILRQKDFTTGNVYIIKVFKRVGWNIKDFAGLVIGRPYTGNNWTYSEEDHKIMNFMRFVRFSGHFGDPYNSDSKTTVTDETIRDALREMGIELTTNRKSKLQERIAKTSLGLNRLFYDSECHEREQAMIQSHYPQIKEGSESTAEKDKPVHDDNSHFRTATEYFFDNEPDHLDNSNDGGIIVNTSLIN